MRILVTGGSGLLGQAIHRRCASQGINVVSGSRRQKEGSVMLDYLDGSSLKMQVRNLGSLDAVINLAAIGSALLCKPRDGSLAQDPYSMEACDANVLLAANVAKVCNALGIPLIHASSAYVFQGVNQDGTTRSVPYSPFDEPNSKTPYGMSKRAAEWYIQRIMQHTPHLILRLPWLYGENGGIMKQLESPNLHDIRINNEQRCNPVYVDDVATWILNQAGEGLEHCPGNIEHLGGPSELTRYGLAEKILTVMGTQARPAPVMNIDEDPLRPPYITLTRPKKQPYTLRGPDEVLRCTTNREGAISRKEIMR